MDQPSKLTRFHSANAVADLIMVWCGRVELLPHTAPSTSVTDNQCTSSARDSTYFMCGRLQGAPKRQVGAGATLAAGRRHHQRGEGSSQMRA